MIKYFKLLPVQLVLVVAIALVLGNYFPPSTVRFFYTISVLIRDLLMFFLPLVIFTYITAALLSFEGRAPILILAIFAFVTLSTAVAVLVSYGVGLACLPLMVSGLTQDYTLHAPLSLTLAINPFFQLALTPGLSPERSMLAAIVTGIFFSLVRVPVVTSVALKLRKAVNTALHYGLIPCLPFYVFGFVLKIHQEGGLIILFHSYAQVFLLILLLFIVYIFGYYWAANIFRIRPTLRALQNMLPAAITGFCTMSSVVTMPVTLESSEKNLKNPTFAQLVIPMTANMHLLGDALGLPLMALAIILMKGQVLPDFMAYLPFVIYFCLAKFSSAGIPGGGVLILLPVLEHHLGLSGEMLSLITTLYILQDAVFTSANVLGNGAFAILVERITRPLGYSHVTVDQEKL